MSEEETIKELENLEVRVKNLGRTQDNVVGVIQYVDEEGEIAEYSFNVPLKKLSDMTLDEFKEHALEKMKTRLEIDLREKRWMRVQRMLKPITVIEQEEDVE